MKETPVIEPRRKGRNGTQSMLIPSERMVATGCARRRRAGSPTLPTFEGTLRKPMVRMRAAR